ncbi:MAG: helix-turn-helix domain-containing protein [Actinomycetota bacterium]|nr:helix-turn-helix domain-containing protein [Actinomycetota bacterium]
MLVEPLWTTGDVARFLSVSQATVRSWQQGHRIPFLKIGGTIRFVPEEIRGWVTATDGGFASHCRR